MNTTAFSLPLTRMVKSNQSVILVDNSPLCSTDSGGVGVMLPFYGSASFLTEQFFENSNHSCDIAAIEHVKECLMNEDTNAIEALYEIVENGKWILYLK